MAKVTRENLGEELFWAYARLAMAHAAVTAGKHSFGRVHFMIRSRLFKGLKTGTMQVGSFKDDERLKMILPQACCYCGSRESLSVDHLIPKFHGGVDRGENLVWACRSCNSSKGKLDLLEWFERKSRQIPILLMRRYLKLAIEFATENDQLSKKIEEIIDDRSVFPFDIGRIQKMTPPPSELKLWVIPMD